MNYKELNKEGLMYAFQIAGNFNKFDNTYGNLNKDGSTILDNYNSYEFCSIPEWLSDFPNSLILDFFNEFKESFNEFFIKRVFVTTSFPDVKFYKDEDDTINLSIATSCCRILVYSEINNQNTYYCISLREGTKLKNESDILIKDKIQDFINNVVIKYLLYH